MTADDASSRSVWLGSDGVLAAPLAAQTFAIECSTLSYHWVMELASEAQARDLRYIDAPVTGLPEHAASGTLTLLVGAEAADLEAATPLLGAISKRILRFGGVGTGTAYKLIINMIGAVQIASVAEWIAIAERPRHRQSLRCARGEPTTPTLRSRPHRVNESKIIEVARLQPPTA
jgi:3-hydroxyisobutyrate dehydrogenase